MDYKELIEQLKYYGTTYAIGDNLGREIDGTDQVMMEAATAIETLLAERETGWVSEVRTGDKARKNCAGTINPTRPKIHEEDVHERAENL